jgi:hypothetical protein
MLGAMSGKLFGFGVLVVLSGFGFGVAAVGCSDDYENRTVEPLEGGPPREAGGGDATPGETCPSTTPVDPAKLAWKPAAPAQAGQCQTDDLDAMREFLVQEPNATNEEFLAFVKNRDAICAECIFADADRATWPPAPVKSGKVVTFNIGACYALVTGKQACGQAVQNTWDCEFDACVECTSADELNGCRAKARTGVCKAYDDKTRAECAGAPSADSVCGSPFDSIREQCVGGSSDGGVQDAAPDAPDAG